MTDTIADAPKKWPLELRFNQDGTPDEIVCDDAYVHLEQMDARQWWMAVEHPETKKKVQVWFSSKSRITSAAPRR